MFDSLDDSIKHELEGEATAKERLIRIVAITVVSVVVIAGLYYAVTFLG
jgi:predicted secreted protein